MHEAALRKLSKYPVIHWALAAEICSAQYPELQVKGGVHFRTIRIELLSLIMKAGTKFYLLSQRLYR